MALPQVKKVSSFFSAVQQRSGRHLTSGRRERHGTVQSRAKGHTRVYLRPDAVLRARAALPASASQKGGISNLRMPSLSTILMFHLGIAMEKRRFISAAHNCISCRASSTVIPGFQCASSNELQKKPQ